MVTINGETFPVEGKTLSEFLLWAHYDTKRIAVERNGEIVSKSKFDETVLKDGDHIEIVRFVGGG